MRNATTRQGESGHQQRLPSRLAGPGIAPAGAPAALVHAAAADRDPAPRPPTSGRRASLPPS
eukprot:4997676-Pyramimonas_sp.AAC.1